MRTWRGGVGDAPLSVSGPGNTSWSPVSSTWRCCCSFCSFPTPLVRIPDNAPPGVERVDLDEIEAAVERDEWREARMNNVLRFYR